MLSNPITAKQDFTNDTDAAAQTVAGLKRGDAGAAILDALDFGIGVLRNQPPAYRRAVLLFSETVDNGSSRISAISAAVIRSRRSDSIACTRRRGKREGLRRGRDDRSSNKRSPSRNRRTHFAAVRPLQPAASAACCSGHPSTSTRRQINKRLLGQVR